MKNQAATVKMHQPTGFFGPYKSYYDIKLLKDDKLWSRLNRKVIDWNSSHPDDSRTIITIAGDLATSQDSQAGKIAEDLLRRVLDREPDSIPAMSSLAMLLQLTGRSVDSVVY